MIRLDNVEETNQELRDEIDRIWEEEVKPRDEKIKKLEVQLAAKSKDSSTSSKPPSSDIVKNKPPKKKGERKRGVQEGHEKHTREPFKESEINKWHVYSLDGCPECSG